LYEGGIHNNTTFLRNLSLCWYKDSVLMWNQSRRYSDVPNVTAISPLKEDQDKTAGEDIQSLEGRGMSRMEVTFIICLPRDISGEHGRAVEVYCYKPRGRGFYFL
jgi:hypothetical protein